MRQHPQRRGELMSEVPVKPILPPVVIFGTGLTRQLLSHSEGTPDIGLVTPNIETLVSWEQLLLGAALRGRAAEDRHAPLIKRPTLFWEELVRQISNAPEFHSGHVSAAQAERYLRTLVAECLKAATTAARDQTNIAKIETLLAKSGTHLVSLNFDTLPFQSELGGQPLRFDRTVKPRLDYLETAGKTVWFPHGCIEAPSHIKLGIRDYGFLPKRWEELFRYFKSWQRSLGGVKGATSEHIHAESIRWLRSAPSKDPTVFIGNILLAPLIFFGVGLSESEWGWWWILNQRARNLNRVPRERRPSTVSVRIATDFDVDFWKCTPAGVNPILVPDWDLGWDRLIGWLESQNELLD